jgi:hypothetical protein
MENKGNVDRSPNNYLHCLIVHSTYYLPLNGGVAIDHRYPRASMFKSTTSGRTPTFSSSINNPRELPFGQTTPPQNSTDLSHFHSRCMASSGKTRNFTPIATHLPQSVEPFTGFNFSASIRPTYHSRCLALDATLHGSQSLSCYSKNLY